MSMSAAPPIRQTPRTSLGKFPSNRRGAPRALTIFYPRIARSPVPPVGRVLGDPRRLLALNLSGFLTHVLAHSTSRCGNCLRHRKFLFNGVDVASGVLF